jgi:hypothetical protein
MSPRVLLAFLFYLVGISTVATAEDYFLTIGGGYSREGNQASLEKNVLFFQRVLKEHNYPPTRHSVFFADGAAGGKDVQVKDAAGVPKANRLMAEFFGSERDLGMHYRNHEVPGVRDSTNPESIRRWFSEVGRTLMSGDRIILYVTAHGERSDDRDNAYNTAISLWGHERLTATQLVELLDQLPDGVSVVAVMVQCYTGGFARFIYNKADPDEGLSKQRRCGFFATVHDREAAGCTPEVDEATYVEYSTYFWEALSGRTRTGQPITPPDYDGNRVVSFDEAHAYTVLKADTIDLPLKTSSEFLSVESQFRDDEHPELLPDNAPFDVVRELATPAERAVLDSLSQQLELEGSARIDEAERERQALRRGFRRRSRGRSSGQRAARLRQTIADDLMQQWPELSNVLNPGAVELLTTRRQSFVEAIEQHPRYREYREQMSAAERRPDPQKRRVKFERFVRTAEDVILRENLKRLSDEQGLAQYQAIVAAESTSLRTLPPRPVQAIAR